MSSFSIEFNNKVQKRTILLNPLIHITYIQLFRKANSKSNRIKWHNFEKRVNWILINKRFRTSNWYYTVFNMHIDCHVLMSVMHYDMTLNVQSSIRRSRCTLLTIKTCLLSCCKQINKHVVCHFLRSLKISAWYRGIK